MGGGWGQTNTGGWGKVNSGGGGEVTSGGWGEVTSGGWGNTSSAGWTTSKNEVDSGTKKIDAFEDSEVSNGGGWATAVGGDWGNTVSGSPAIGPAASPPIFASASDAANAAQGTYIFHIGILGKLS